MSFFEFLAFTVTFLGDLLGAWLPLILAVGAVVAVIEVAHTVRTRRRDARLVAPVVEIKGGTRQP